MYNWKNKNVLITGINGFVGSNLCKKLINLNANIFGTINNNSTSSLLNFENLSQKVNIINVEKNNFLQLKEIIKNYEINYIYHLAAQVEVVKANQDPYFTLRNNINYTLDLLEASRLAESVNFFYFASTDKVYGDVEKHKLPYKEKYIPKPTFPYDISKYISEILVNCYKNNYSIPLVIGRTCNLYGPGQLNFSALIPDCIRSALGFSTFKPRTNGNHYRDFLYISDVVDLYLIMAEKMSENKALGGEIFNAGSNNPINIKSLIMKIFELVMNEKSYIDFKRNLIFPKSESVGEILFQQMDFQKVSKSFEWRPATHIDRGLALSIDWYQKYLKDKKL